MKIVFVALLFSSVVIFSCRKADPEAAKSAHPKDSKSGPASVSADQGIKPHPLEMSLQGFEKQIITDACKLESPTQIRKGVFKGYSLHSYDCRGLLRHKVVTDGTKIFKYTSILEARTLKDPEVIARGMDRELFLKAWASLYTTARNIPQGQLDKLLMENSGALFRSIPMGDWEKAIKLDVPYSSTRDGYVFLCEPHSDEVRLIVEPEETYFKEKSLRLHGGSQ